MMRLENLLLALALVAAPAAAAQELPDASTAPSQISRQEAVQEIYDSLLFQTGIFEAITEQFLPAYRQQAMASAYYRNARGERRAALDRVIEDTPRFLREEIVAETQVMAANASARAGDLLSTEDILALARFISDPAWRPFMQRMALHGASNGTAGALPEITPEEEARMESYAGVHFSERLVNNSNAFMGVLLDEMNAAGPRLQRRIQVRVGAEICTALGNQCPRELRDQSTTL